MGVSFAEFVGCYRLVVSEDLLAFIERTWVEPAPLAERDRVRREAQQEAQGAEIEIRADGTFISRSGEQELYRVTLSTGLDEQAQLCFEKTPGQRVCLRLLDGDRVLAMQSGKPDNEFRRIA